jgi:hypothetical protein
MVVRAGEVLFSFDCPVVLPQGFGEFQPYPFAIGEVKRTDVSHDAFLAVVGSEPLPDFVRRWHSVRLGSRGFSGIDAASVTSVIALSYEGLAGLEGPSIDGWLCGVYGVD